MKLGVPTLCSREGSLPEVAGDAGLVVDPYDVSAIAKGLRTLDQDADLRKRLVSAGSEQSRCFSSEVYQQRLQDMYTSVLA